MGKHAPITYQPRLLAVVRWDRASGKCRAPAESAAPPLSENAVSEALDARRYLTAPSADLAMVCMFAGVDMEALVDPMRVQVAKAPRVGQIGSGRTFAQ